MSSLLSRIGEAFAKGKEQTLSSVSSSQSQRVEFITVLRKTNGATVTSFAAVPERSIWDFKEGYIYATGVSTSAIQVPVWDIFFRKRGSTNNFWFYSFTNAANSTTKFIFYGAYNQVMTGEGGSFTDEDGIVVAPVGMKFQSLYPGDTIRIRGVDGVAADSLTLELFGKQLVIPG